MFFQFSLDFLFAGYIIDDAKRDLVLIFKKNFYFFQHNKKEPENFNFKVLPTH